ncbi:MAG: DUF6273 domain-containing protein [Lachnospiraceae bacterium]|nr:DUF6273 domain-containing protein [Lachnospiraceae bacterium]
MRKRFFKLISGVLSFTMLALSVDFSVLAAEPVICEEVTDDTVSEDAEIISEEIDESEVMSEECTDDNRIDFDNEAASEEASEETEEKSVIVEETAEDGVPCDDEIAGEDAVIEEIPEEEIPDEVLAEDELNGKTAAKEKTRAELYEEARKKDGVTLDKTADEISNPYENPDTFEGPDRYVYDAIYFGAYLQTDTDKDGKFDDEQKEPIRWRVLSVDDENRALLWSDKVLDQYVYLNSIPSEKNKYVFWHNSTIRSWLNGYNADENYDKIDFSTGSTFISEAFNESERNNLIQKELTGNFIDQINTESDSENFDTSDKVFLLSLDDVQNEEYGCAQGNITQGDLDYSLCRAAKLTDYASQDEYVINGTKEVIPQKERHRKFLNAYFLRTAKNKTGWYSDEFNFAAGVDCTTGHLSPRWYFPSGPDYDEGNIPQMNLGGVRPAIYIDLDEADWAYAGKIASDGASDSTIKVYFDPNGGTFDYDYEVYSILEKEYRQDRPKPAREGYIFSGWKKYYPDGKEASMSPDTFCQTDGMYYVAQWWYNGGDSATIRLYFNADDPDAYVFAEPSGVGSPFFTSTYPENYYIVNKCPEQEPYFLGWYTALEGGRRITLADRIEKSRRLYAHWDTSEVDERDIPNLKFNEFWTSEVGDVEYTGGKLKPEIRVYYGFKRLKEGKDYTITFANNVNICDKSETKAPIATIKGKGYYSSTETIKFSIVSKSLSADEEGKPGENVTIPDLYIKADGTEKKPIPSVKASGKSLKVNTDFTVKYYVPGEPEEELTEISTVKEPGEYILEVSGKGKYCGKARVKLVVSAGTDISKLKFSTIKDAAYNFEGTHEVCPDIVIKDGTYELVEGTDYECTYINNDKVGTASVIITGTDKAENEKQYYGTKTLTFKIVPEDIKGVTVTGIEENADYAVKEITFDNIAVTKNGRTLAEGTDYTVSYEKNKNCGKAAVVIKGINGYKGTVKKTFKINPINLTEASKVYVDSFEESVVYTVGGTIPSFDVKFTVGEKTYILQKNSDYAVKCSNNTKVNDGTGKNKPTVKIIGKGNFKGTIEKTFVITEANFDKVKITVSDKEYQNKKGKWKSSVTITDTNGKKLKAGKDYDKKITYSYDGKATVKNGKKEIVRYPGEKINSKDIIPAGTIVRVTVKGKGGFPGERVVTYRIRKKNISKLKVTVKNFEYTGREITPGPEDIKVMDGNEEIPYFMSYSNLDEYEIIGYKNNVNIGTAEVTIKAFTNNVKAAENPGNYYGTKTVKFKITPKKIKWWWNKEN